MLPHTPPTTSDVTKKSRIKSRYEALGFFFGPVLKKFDDLLPLKPDLENAMSMDSSYAQPSTSSGTGFGQLDLPMADSISVTMPRKIDIVKHWMSVTDEQFGPSSPKKSPADKNSILWKVTENLIKFWTDHNSKELR